MAKKKEKIEEVVEETPQAENVSVAGESVGVLAGKKPLGCLSSSCEPLPGRPE